MNSYFLIFILKIMKNILLCCLIHFIFIFIIIPNYITNNNIYLFAYILLLDIATFINYL